MKPELMEGQYVFTVVPDDHSIPGEHIICSFREHEGKTLILKREKADELGMTYSFIASWIVLRVHSSLEAVGLTARVATALAETGISCNAIAASHHDHIFVPIRKTDQAMAILRNLV
jgi:hypothetical protein